MILTEEKTYIINVTEVDTDAELGLNKKLKLPTLKMGSVP